MLMELDGIEGGKPVMSTQGGTVRTMRGAASEQYERLEGLRREHLEELKERLGQLRVALDAADPVEVNDIEALCDHSWSAGISAAIVEITSRTLQDIECALERLESGTYGKCSDCEAEIPAARLRAMPFADRCRDCQELANADRRVLAA
jgi:DnaK suppressor protein